jgi:protein-L-isoaspartate(D-aspartate) O-methyltransferase
MDVVGGAMDSVSRRGFLPGKDRLRAGFDGPIQIGHGQTNSQPRTVEAMLRLLDVRPGQHVLDVGAGSGWTTALLAHLTGPSGSVVGVELVQELAEWGGANLASTPYDWASIRTATAEVLGVPESAPYDRILVSADAPSLPQALVDQLGEEARMVLPVNSTMLLVVRRGEDVEVTQHGSYRFVPLR